MVFSFIMFVGVSIKWYDFVSDLVAVDDYVAIGGCACDGGVYCTGIDDGQAVKFFRVCTVSMTVQHHITAKFIGTQCKGQ